MARLTVDVVCRFAAFGTQKMSATDAGAFCGNALPGMHLLAIETVTEQVAVAEALATVLTGASTHRWHVDAESFL